MEAKSEEEEFNELALESQIMERNGFKKILWGRKEQGYDPGYTHSLRISEMQYLLYDRNGFMTIQRIRDKKGPAGYGTDNFITLPKPIRTDRDLKNLLKAITI